MSDPEGKAPKKITDSTTRKARSCGRRIRRCSSTRPRDKKLYSYSVADGKTSVITTSTSAASAPSRSLPTANGSRSRSRIARCDRTSTSRPSAAAKSATSPTTALLYSESERRLDGATAAISSSRRPRAPATASRRRVESPRRWRLWARVAARPGSRSRATATSTTKRRGSRRKQRRARTPGAAAAGTPQRRRRCGSTGAACRGARAS